MRRPSGGFEFFFYLFTGICFHGIIVVSLTCTAYHWGALITFYETFNKRLQLYKQF